MKCGSCVREAILKLIEQEQEKESPKFPDAKSIKGLKMSELGEIKDASLIIRGASICFDCYLKTILAESAAKEEFVTMLNGAISALVKGPKEDA